MDVETRSAIDDLRTEMYEGFAGLRADMHAGFSSLRSEMNQRFEKVDKSIEILAAAVLRIEKQLGSN